MMTPLDYGRSFLIGKGPENEVRFWVESRTRITDGDEGKGEYYIQVGSCKSEDTFAQRELFYKDNYDFLPIFGPKYGIIFRRKAWLNTNYKSCLEVKDMWGGQRYHLVDAGSFEELLTNEAIIGATHRFSPIVAQTEIWDTDTGFQAIIEYPIKTMNTNPQKKLYQVDTGPIAFPDLSRVYERHVEGISLAFVAFNAPHFADFIIEAPTPIHQQGGSGEEVCQVHHYSRRVSLNAKNRLYAINVSPS